MLEYVKNKIRGEKRKKRGKKREKRGGKEGKKREKRGEHRGKEGKEGKNREKEEKKREKEGKKGENIYICRLKGEIRVEKSHIPTFSPPFQNQPKFSPLIPSPFPLLFPSPSPRRDT